MKPLLIAVLLSGPSLAPADGAWWSQEWTYRRALLITNRLERPLAKGFTLQVEVDPEYLGLRDKSRPGLEDWALVRGTLRVPFLLQPGRGKTVLLCFRTVEDLRPGASDGYFLYYGAASAAPPRAAAESVFDLWEDFSRPGALAERFQVDPDLSAAVEDGALVIREVAAGRAPSGPARITFRTFPSLAGFEMSFDLEMDSSDAAAASFAVTVDLKQPGAEDPALGKRIAGLIERLGDDAWEDREKATRELIAIGRPAAAQLGEALRAADAEVKWRADHILREIRVRSPAPVISAGVQGGDPKMPVALSSVIGKNETRLQHRTGWPVRTRIVLQRDPEGDVKLLWNGRFPQSGQMAGEIQRVAFTIGKGSASPLGVIRIGKIQVCRFVDEESRPTSTIDVEETRP